MVEIARYSNPLSGTDVNDYLYQVLTLWAQHSFEYVLLSQGRNQERRELSIDTDIASLSKKKRNVSRQRLWLL